MKELGDSKIKYYQLLIIFIFIIAILPFVLLYIITGNHNYGLMTLIILIVQITILFFYLKVSSIKYNSTKFVVANLFSKKEFSSNDFIKVQKYFLTFVFKIHMKNENFYFILNSNEFFKALFSYNEYDEKLTKDIKQFIDKN